MRNTRDLCGFSRRTVITTSPDVMIVTRCRRFPAVRETARGTRPIKFGVSKLKNLGLTISL